MDNRVLASSQVVNSDILPYSYSYIYDTQEAPSGSGG
jgi:hypothetical protein